MKFERAIEILDPNHRENYENLRTVEIACKMGMEAMRNPLLTFIRQEVPYRLADVLEVPSAKITPALVKECVNKMYDSCDMMFNYDWIDEFLADILKKNGIYVFDGGDDRGDSGGVEWREMTVGAMQSGRKDWGNLGGTP